MCAICAYKVKLYVAAYPCTADLAAIEAESIGWLPLGDGAYLNVGDLEGDVITVVGVPQAGMAGVNVLLVG